nr:DUF512 domain-containing protein [Anaerolineae bacterium]
MTNHTPPVTGGLVKSVQKRSLAGSLGIKPGDTVLAVNCQPVQDVIDVQYYSAEYDVEIEVERSGQRLTLSGQRKPMQPLGIEFEHPTFDMDIRRCNNLCEFCFVLQMSPGFRRTLYIKDDDYRYSFLSGHYVTLTNLTDHDRWRIVNQHLSPLYISVHDTDVERRRRLLRNDTAPDILAQLKWLIENGIEVHTQVVVVPGVNDGEPLESSVHRLAELFPGVQTISVVPVGLTRYHRYGRRTHTIEEAQVILDTCHAWQKDFKRALGVNFVYPTDEWYLVAGKPVPGLEAYDGHDLTENGLGTVRRFLDEWQQSRHEIVKPFSPQGLTLVTGMLFHCVLQACVDEFVRLTGTSCEAIPVTNTMLGETITVAGLLMGRDVIDQLAGRSLGDVVVLPRVMFDHPDGISLDDLSPGDVAAALNRPVILADLMGDLVDLVNGKPSALFTPSRRT